MIPIQQLAEVIRRDCHKVQREALRVWATVPTPKTRIIDTGMLAGHVVSFRDRCAWAGLPDGAQGTTLAVAAALAQLPLGHTITAHGTTARGETVTTDYTLTPRGWMLFEAIGPDEPTAPEFPLIWLAPGVRARVAHECGYPLTLQFHDAFDEALTLLGLTPNP